MHIARKFKDLCRVVGEIQELQCRFVLEHLDALRLMLNKLKIVQEDDPNCDPVLHRVGVYVDAVLKTIRNAGIKEIKIPPVMHIFKTFSRQEDLARQIALQIIS